MKARLYGLPGSHPTMAVGAMLEYKGIDFRRIDLVPFLSRVIVRRAMGLPQNTVPVLTIEGRRIQGSREISRELERLRPEPPLFPSDAGQRFAVEEAERWGEEELQHPIRQVSLGASVRLLLTFQNLRPLIEDRPACRLARRAVPTYAGDAPPVFPPAWLEPLRSAAAAR